MYGTILSTSRPTPTATAPKLPKYISGRAAWDADEQQILEDGLLEYDPKHYTNMTVYVKIAAMLPRKTVS